MFGEDAQAWTHEMCPDHVTVARSEMKIIYRLCDHLFPDFYTLSAVCFSSPLNIDARGGSFDMPLNFVTLNSCREVTLPGFSKESARAHLLQLSRQANFLLVTECRRKFQYIPLEEHHKGP